MDKTLLAAVAAFSAVACFAADGAAPAAPAAATNAPAVKTFTTLPLCQRIEGTAFVRKPGGAWTAAEEGKFYPFGTGYRVGAGGSMVVAFGPGSTATIADGAEFGTREQALGVAQRSIFLVRGTVVLNLPANLAEGAFSAAAPGFTVKNPAGESSLTYMETGDGDEAVVRCVTGSLGVEGRHFDIATMRAANEVRIRTSKDHLSTILFGTSGDYVVRVSQGCAYKDEVDEEGKVRTAVEDRSLEWRLSPYTKIVINRAVPAIGERMSVHTMAFDASGERKSECYFCEGRAEVNSGELVAKAAVDGEEIAKRAAEVTETTAADAAEEETTTEAAESEDSSEDSSN
ncbi:MAG: hypothetical protein ACI4RD_01465 [Kiritimatiellia bacterium]